LTKIVRADHGTTGHNPPTLIPVRVAGIAT